jgi:hypothetical protein
MEGRMEVDGRKDGGEKMKARTLRTEGGGKEDGGGRRKVRRGDGEIKEGRKEGRSTS